MKPFTNGSILTAEELNSSFGETLAAAEAAQTTANTAKSNAANAQTTANTAKSNAANAQTTANTAKSAAEAAQLTANQALAAAGSGGGGGGGGGGDASMRYGFIKARDISWRLVEQDNADQCIWEAQLPITFNAVGLPVFASWVGEDSYPQYVTGWRLAVANTQLKTLTFRAESIPGSIAEGGRLPLDEAPFINISWLVLGVTA